jgi:hypothetical protein
LDARLRGLAFAREKGLVLTWDEKDWLYLFSRTGVRQGQVRNAGRMTAACVADDGTAVAAVGHQGEVWWLAPDLTCRWERAVPRRASMAALDPFGQYLAVSDTGGGLHLFDRHGRDVFHVQTPRPLRHLAFIPAQPLLVGSADYGLVAGFDPTGHCVWRDGPVANTGSLAVNEDGSEIVLACYTEGMYRYDRAGKPHGRWSIGEPCRQAVLSFDGTFVLAAGMSNRLVLRDRTGQTECTHALDKPPAGIALAALAEAAYVALTEGAVLGFDLGTAARSA